METPRNSIPDAVVAPRPHLVRSDYRVLLVEDAEELIAIWRALFRSTTWDMRFVTKAKDALTTVADGFVPDLLVTDYYLPDMTGIELINKLRAQLPELSCVMVSGNRDQQFNEEVAACGDVRLLYKPVKFPDLKSALQEELLRAVPH